MEESRNTVVVTPGFGILSLRIGPEILRRPLSTEQYKERVNVQFGKVFPDQRVVEDTTINHKSYLWAKIVREYSKTFEEVNTVTGELEDVEMVFRQGCLLRTETVHGECVAFAHTWTCSPELWSLYDPIFFNIATSISYKMN
eukprot:EC691243.1.p1 GENE.EC691243.1~~EC691243.1.p1  ORF type:complete len:142 (+),score=40.84 EC691243.1:172-597(+)